MRKRLTIAFVTAGLVGAGCGGPGRSTGTSTSASQPIGNQPTSSPPAAGPVAAGDTVGTDAPLVVEAAARNGAWVVICQARADTDGDGEIAVHTGMHGDTWGDRFQPYLVRGAGAGEPIDSLIGYTADGRWVVALRQGALAVLDSRTGAWTELPGADLRDDGVPFAPHRAASVAADGARMTYLRDDDTLVIRDLDRGVERAVDVPGARLWRLEVERPGALARVYALRTDTDGDGALTWPSAQTSLSDRDCRGPIMSYSTGGWDGDKPDQLWLDLASGAITATRPAAAPPVEEPDDEPLGTVDGHPVLAIDGAGRRLLGPGDDGRDLPRGPLRWVTP